VDDTIFRGLLIFGRQELVEYAVELGKLADLVITDQVDAVEASVEGFEAAHIAVIAEEIVQKAGGKAAAVGTTAGGNAADGGKEAVGMQAALFYEGLDPLRFFAGDQRIFDLLRIDTRCIIGEQRNGFLRSDDAWKNLVALQQARPDIQMLFALTILGSEIFAVAGANQGGGVVGRV